MEGGDWGGGGERGQVSTVAGRRTERLVGPNKKRQKGSAGLGGRVKNARETGQDRNVAEWRLRVKREMDDED